MGSCSIDDPTPGGGLGMKNKDFVDQGSVPALLPSNLPATDLGPGQLRLCV